MQQRRTDWILLAVLWAVLTAIGEAMAIGLDLLPGQWAREAEVVDNAYKLLIGLAVPVFALVAAALLVSMVRFRVKVGGVPTEDGPPISGNRRLLNGWLVATSALALLVTINPGFVGLAELRGEDRADMVIEVEAMRWAWRFTYPNGGTTGQELVVPVDKRIRFEVSSLDILHSFWVPAFRTKIDAVPGRTTKLFVTPERVGGPDDDFGLRVQCAELCGLSHARMAVPVRVLAQAEFDEWMKTLERRS